MARSIRPRPVPDDPRRGRERPAPRPAVRPLRRGPRRGGRRRRRSTSSTSSSAGGRPPWPRAGPATACRSGARWATASARPPGGPGRLRRRRDRPDAVPGPRALVARPGRLRRPRPPARAGATVGHAALRRPDRRAGRRASTTSAPPGIAVELATDDGSAGHHGFVTDLLAAPPGARRAAGQGRRLRPARDARRAGAAGRAARGRLRPLAREPHGLRLRRLLQLRRPDPPGRRLDRPPPRLRRGARLPRRARRLVGARGPLTPTRPIRSAPRPARIWSRSRAARS